VLNLSDGRSPRRELEHASALIEQPGFHRELLRADWCEKGRDGRKLRDRQGDSERALVLYLIVRGVGQISSRGSGGKLEVIVLGSTCVEMMLPKLV